jgi:hypothetical protein
VTPFAPLPTVPSELYGLTVSINGQMIGFTTTACRGAKAQPNYVGVTNIATGHTTRWTTPSRNSVDASAAPGIAADRGRTVVRAPAGRWIPLSQIFADGGEVYYSDYTEATLGQAKPMTGQIRAMDLVAGQVAYLPSRQFSLPAVLYW